MPPHCPCTLEMAVGQSVTESLMRGHPSAQRFDCVSLAVLYYHTLNSSFIKLFGFVKQNHTLLQAVPFGNFAQFYSSFV